MIAVRNVCVEMFGLVIHLCQHLVCWCIRIGQEIRGTEDTGMLVFASKSTDTGSFIITACITTQLLPKGSPGAEDLSAQTVRPIMK